MGWNLVIITYELIIYIWMPLKPDQKGKDKKNNTNMQTYSKF